MIFISNIGHYISDNIFLENPLFRWTRISSTGRRVCIVYRNLYSVYSIQGAYIVVQRRRYKIQGIKSVCHEIFVMCDVGIQQNRIQFIVAMNISLFANISQ